MNHRVPWVAYRNAVQANERSPSALVTSEAT